MTLQEEIQAVRLSLDGHIQWDNSEHALLRKEHEIDNRLLVQAVNSLQVTVERGINKVIMVVCGALLSATLGTIIFVIPHIH